MLGRDVPVYDVRLGVYIILVLGSLLLVIFTMAVYVPCVSCMCSTSV